jgi:hypothetical protein
MQARGSRRRHRVWRFALRASQVLWECEGADVFTRARRQIIRSALRGSLSRPALRLIIIIAISAHSPSPEGGVVPRAKSPHLGFLDERSLTPMAESPAETARVQMQSGRARGVSLHRPCPALWLPSFRGYPARLSGSAFCCNYTKASKTSEQTLVPRGRTCSGHPRLPGRCRSRVQRRGWPEQVRPRGSRVLSSAL